MVNNFLFKVSYNCTTALTFQGKKKEFWDHILRKGELLHVLDDFVLSFLILVMVLTGIVNFLHSSWCEAVFWKWKQC